MILVSEETTSVDAKDYYAVMIHFYRGELGRIMAWRQRLDVTTNWAIVSTTAMSPLAAKGRVFPSLQN